MSTDPTTAASGPLTGLRIVELGGIGPGPFCGMLLADQGADVIRIDRHTEVGNRTGHPVLHRNRRSVALDLKNPRDVETVLKIIDTADAVIEGFRPGVTERLGIGPDSCLARNPKLVYGRMTGWGQDGPLAQEPGHDINYIALTGALGAMGSDGDVPPVPLNLIGDMGGGGMLLALGMTTAMLRSRIDGRGQVVDAAMTDGTAVQLALIHGLLARDRWVDRRASNMFDGAAPFYRTYRCADGRFVAVGCVEPQFYAAMLRVLDLTDDLHFARQHDRDAWPTMAERLAQVFSTRPRTEWESMFDGQGACVSPVLTLTEAAAHPHNVSRGTFGTFGDGFVQPSPAPRYLGTPASAPTPAPYVGAHTREVLAEIGVDAGAAAALA
ncbi:MAG: CoA transferase [Rhodococcus sp. (in: high G+C Gram-positive bacteria)]|jgi:alpha-methylacyl-CoA racemase|nr:MAG: CoA transferase [Rhodococcus sp. (in: high G+C Gram-positive bacteria)]